MSDDGSEEPDDFVAMLRALREPGPPFVAQARKLLEQLHNDAGKQTTAKSKSTRGKAKQKTKALLDTLDRLKRDDKNPSREWVARHFLRRACFALKLRRTPLPREPEEVASIAKRAMELLPKIPVGRPLAVTAPIVKVAIELNAQRNREASSDGAIFEDGIWRVAQGVSTESASPPLSHTEIKSALAASSTDPEDDNAMETAHRTASRMRHRKKR